MLPPSFKVFILLKMLPQDIRKRVIELLSPTHKKRINEIISIYNGIKHRNSLYTIIAKELISSIKFGSSVNIFLFSMLMFLLLSSVVGYILSPKSFEYYFINMLFHGGIHLIIFVFVAIYYGGGIKQLLRFKSKGKKANAILYGFLLIPLLMLLNIGINTSKRIDIIFIFYFISAISYGAFIEELVFRKFIFDAIKINTIAILLSSILFAIAHLPQDILSFAILWFCGFILSYSYIEGGLASSFITHSLANAINIILSLF